MSTNLLRPAWARLDSHEIRIVLAERIGGPGQYDNRNTNPNRLHLPLAGAACRIILTFRGRELASVKPGERFDTAQWNAIVEEIDTSVLVGPMKVGRDYSFSSYRVPACWRGQRSGVQINPPHPDAPLPPCETGRHPFILEFPLKEAGLMAVTKYRWIREHRNLSLLLNVLLRGRTDIQVRRSEHFWACIWKKGAEPVFEWAQNFYFAPIGTFIDDSPSPMTADRLEEIEPDQYYNGLIGIDGRPLRVPADLDDSICLYQNLVAPRRADFDRAAYWLDVASRQWNFSMSASFASLVSAVESLINERGPGSTGRFRDFFETYAPGATLAARRSKIYDLRSTILHGGDLMVIDQEGAFGWDPPWWNERELHEELWTVTRAAMRNWLRNPPAR